MSVNKTVALARKLRREPLCLRLSEIAAMVQGELVGADDPWITGLAGIHDANEGDLTFLGNRRYRAGLAKSRASAVLVDRQEPTRLPAVRVNDPAMAFALVLQHVGAATRVEYPAGVHPTAVIGDGVQIGSEVSIGAHVVLDNDVEIGDRTTILPGTVILRETHIGNDCLIYPNVTIREETIIGDRVIVQCGAVIGSDGFGFVSDGSRLHKVHHIGRVVLEDDVEVGANACIDRATTGETRVGRGTKIDNLVQLAHNVKVGENSILCAQVGVSGSTEIGNRVKLAGQVGLVGHIRIGDDAVVGAQAGVVKSIPPRTMSSGYPARPHARELRQQAALVRLPELLETVRDLRRRLERLEGGDS
ncbi:MAG: UDP-3-O-(3-hydroxymyristoyl)glucosamine N-acyltransferase [Candidatus Latescibacterota bacterium]|nr:MAG: UDP-3-O-(3-hydroxymyristoyl)glucosamine N-acyltransferase [Candidatus Latescibacterota bacterium]